MILLLFLVFEYIISNLTWWFLKQGTRIRVYEKISKKSDKSNESQGFLKPLIYCLLLPLKQLEY